MYLDFFGLKEEPFSLTPNPNFIYLSPQHEVALASLKYGISQRKGFLLLTGEVGTGKTTICRDLLQSLGETTHTSVVLNPLLPTEEILRSINRDFGIKKRTTPKCDELDCLNKFLLELCEKNENAILLIDEAQNLSFKSLEMIRLLSNLESDEKKLLQIILVGQPELQVMLNSYRLRQLNQRISIREKLFPLNAKEIKKYIEHRLYIAGSRGNITFTNSSIRNIYKYSKGFPRVLNNLCDRALLAAYASDKKIINKKIVQESFRNLQGETFNPFWRFWACP